uniref:Uncharacterized protein n=1 Tax=Oryza brachyantha TaxID=4533 RepID=J3KYT4_ORYBR
MLRLMCMHADSIYMSFMPLNCVQNVACISFYMIVLLSCLVCYVYALDVIGSACLRAK